MEPKADPGAKPVNKFWRWVPILAALMSCFVVGGIGVALTVMDIVRDNSGRGIGAAALIVSVIVLLVTKELLKKKIEPKE